MEALEYTIDFVKTCNLKMLYLVFGTKVCITHLNLLFSNALFTHFYDAIVFHSYDVNWSSVFLHYDRSSWTTFMLRCEITTFKLKKTTFVVYLIVLSPNAKRKNKEGKIAQKNIFLHLFILQDCEVMEFVC